MTTMFGLNREPELSDETFELLEGIYGSETFTKGEAVGMIEHELDTTFDEALRRFEGLVKADCIAQLR